MQEHREDNACDRTQKDHQRQDPGRTPTRPRTPAPDGSQTQAFKISFKGIATVPATFFHELLITANAALEKQERPEETIYLEHMPRAPQPADIKIAALTGRKIVRRAGIWVISKTE